MSDAGLAILLVVLIVVAVLTLRELVDQSTGSTVYRGRGRKPSSMRRAA